MSDLITITGGSINGSVFSITLPEQPLIANTAGAKIEITFDSSWSDYLNLNNNKNIKAIFTTQEIDPIAVYNDSGKTYWKGTGLTRQIIIPAQVYSAPGFTINIVGFALDTSMGVYSERYTTNSVYVRVYPSGPVSGSYIGLNPALDWADLVPTAISKADWAASTVTTLLSDFQECLTSYSELVAEASHLTLIDTVTTDTVDDNNQKGVKSQGIFDFVEVTAHTHFEISSSFEVTDRTALKIQATSGTLLVQNSRYNNSVRNTVPFLEIKDSSTDRNKAALIDLQGTYTLFSAQNTTPIPVAKFSGGPVKVYSRLDATNISATNTTTTNLTVTSNATIENLLTIPAGAKINATATSVTCINITRSTNVQSEPVLNIEVASTENSNLLGPAIRLKSHHTYRQGGTTQALLEVVSDGGTAARFWGTVGVKSILWLDGSQSPDGTVLVVGNSSAPKATINNAGNLAIVSGTYSGTWTKSSLVSLKENIQRAPEVLSKILKTDICTYHLKQDPTPYIEYGMIIGGNYYIPPEILSYDKQAINTHSMATFAWKGIQELNEKIVSLENRVAELEAQLETKEESSLER